MAISPIKGDLTAGIAAKWSETLNAQDDGLVTGDAPAQSWMLLPAAAGLTLSSRQVVGMDGAGRIVPATYGETSGVKATGTLTFSGTGTEADTITIGGVVYTLTATVDLPNEVLIGASATATAANLVAAINGGAGAGTTYGTGTAAHPTVVASSAAAVVTVTARIAGAAGNSITTTEAGTGASFGAAVLGGGAGGVYTGVKAMGFISYAPSGATTDGQLVGVTLQGVFNPDLLVFDASFNTAEKKRLAFMGAPAPSNIIIRAIETMTV